MMVKELEVNMINYEWYIIKTSNTLYQIWKFVIIIMSFVTSFTYAYYAAFLDLMSKEEIEGFESQEIFFTILFTVDIFVNFLTEYRYPMSTDIETDVKKIAIIYIKGRFFWDFLSVIPFKKIFWNMDLKYNKLFYINKLSRLYNGFVLLDYKIYVKELKDMITNNIKRIIKEDPERANS